MRGWTQTSSACEWSTAISRWTAINSTPTRSCNSVVGWPRRKGPESKNPTPSCSSTADATGRPSARTVLLKGLSPMGFDFFTNYESRKAAEIEANPVGGGGIPLGPDPSPGTDRRQSFKGGPWCLRRVFRSRGPPESRLASAASPQSQVVASREELEERLEELRRRYPDGDVPRPPALGRLSDHPVHRTSSGRGGKPDFTTVSGIARTVDEWQIERLAP